MMESIDKIILRISFAIITVLFIQCQSKENKSTVEPEEVEDTKYIEYVFDIHSTLPKFTFTVDPSKYRLYIRNYDDTSKLIQNIKLDTEMELEYATTEAFNIRTVDYNFDGYMDFDYPVISGSGGEWFSIWLYDPRQGTFNKSEDLSRLTSPKIDPEKKTITSHDVGGMAGLWYNMATYKFANRKLGLLVLIRSEQQTSYNDGDDQYIRSVSLLGDDGEMHVACEVLISFIDDLHEERCLVEGEWEECDDDPYYFSHSSEYVVTKVDGQDEPCYPERQEFEEEYEEYEYEEEYEEEYMEDEY